MDSNPDRQALNAQMEAQLARLRGMLTKTIDHIDARDMPETPLEDFRHLRSLEVAARLTVLLHTPAAELRPAKAASRAGTMVESEDPMPPIDDVEGWTAYTNRKFKRMRDKRRSIDSEFDSFCTAQDAFLARQGPFPDPGAHFSDLRQIAELWTTTAFVALMAGQKDLAREVYADCAAMTAAYEAEDQDGDGDEDEDEDDVPPDDQTQNGNPDPSDAVSPEGTASDPASPQEKPAGWAVCGDSPRPSPDDPAPPDSGPRIRSLGPKWPP